MLTRNWSELFTMFACVSVLAFLAGCGSTEDPAAADTSATGGTPVAEADHDHEHEHEGEDGHDLHGWWCTEHGVPEEECALCQSDLIAQFKADGDWCDEHNRPDSQCFICDPSRFETFAARYEARFGERPPESTE